MSSRTAPTPPRVRARVAARPDLSAPFLALVTAGLLLAGLLLL